MARILLTSSQVSVVVSATIVVFCTFALFLSGYVLQQRTLRELRVAIRPRETRTSPQSHLPEYFKQKLIQQEDGSFIKEESEAQKAAREDAQVIEVRETVPERAAQPRSKNYAIGEVERKTGATRAQISMVEALKAKAAAHSWGVEHPDPLANSRIPVTRAERRKLIKDEIQRLAQSEKPMYYQRRLW